MKNLENSLVFHGFTRLEAKIYLSLLENGHVRVSQLGQITGITRTQLYPLLEKMVERGYIKQVGEKPVKYCAISPSELSKHLEERNLNRIEKLSELKSELEKIKQSQRFTDAEHKIYIIKEKANIVRKLTELFTIAKEEVVLDIPFGENLFEDSKKLNKIMKSKIKRGIKFTIYCSMKSENLYKFSELEKMFSPKSLKIIIKEKSQTVGVFDRKYVIVVFHNKERKYDNAFYFENREIADMFATKGISSIESYPLKGEVRSTIISGERALLMPPVIDAIPKREQYKLGYGVGWYGIKKFNGQNYSSKTLMFLLQMQMMVNGWGKIYFSGRNKLFTITIENSVVPPEFVKGNIEGFLSVMGRFDVKKKAVNEKKKKYSFSIRKK
ncbi:hypothetical protein DRQ26_01375 [bacterium]|nr:MAG: hypothetical protein DRQ26_01375 [bacterium]